jgi:ribosomal-protein-alanine N-acetyltransferase
MPNCVGKDEGVRRRRVMEISRSHLRDIPAILDLQRRSPPAAQWQEGDYARLLADPNALLLVARYQGLDGKSGLAGFAAWQQVGNEAELRNLAVDPAYRRQGIGRLLLTQSHRELAGRGVTHAYLEVRTSNQAAISLYYALGYERLGVRKGYYSRPPEDALILSARLANAV